MLIFEAKMFTLIKNGSIVTPAETFISDLLIEDGMIREIGQDISCPVDEVIDASGLYVLPGGVDAHVHLDLPMAGTVSSDDHYTGTKAAAFGGTTTVIDFISQDSDDLLALVDQMRKKADAKAAVDYSFHMNITHYNKKVDQAIPQLVKEGITSLKVFTAYNNRLRLQDGEIFQVLRTAKKAGLLTMMHAENGDVIDLLIKEAVEARHFGTIWHARTRPAWGAAESVATGIGLAATAEAPLYIVHMNTAGEVDQLEYARSLGISVMGETCPQYLFFTEKELEREDGAKWVCSPPMRREEDQQRLWEGLEDGVIQTIATDHCPFFFDGTKPIQYEGQAVAIPGKELGKGDFTKIPNGLPGVGDRMPVMWTQMVSSGRFSVNQFVQLTCANPAKVFGIYPRKGCLLPGADADIVLWDPGKKVKYGKAFSQQRTDYNLFEGWDLLGYPVRTISHGKTIVDQGKWLGKAGDGKFIPCSPFNEVL
jgi:dihydropyrimidinase